nr:MAG TPA: hypothetical protein [Caudoviricetes sp.]
MLNTVTLDRTKYLHKAKYKNPRFPRRNAWFFLFLHLTLLLFLLVN